MVPAKMMDSANYESANKKHLYPHPGSHKELLLGAQAFHARCHYFKVAERSPLICPTRTEDIRKAQTLDPKEGYRTAVRLLQTKQELP
jgi:hypothetical protein